MSSKRHVGRGIVSPAGLFSSGFVLLRSSSFLSSLFVAAAAEDARPEAALLLPAPRSRLRRSFVRRALRAGARGTVPAAPAPAARSHPPAWAAGPVSLPKTPASAIHESTTTACSGHIVGRLRALDEVLGVDHRPCLEEAVAIDDLDVVAAAVRQLAGHAADVDADDVRGPRRATPACRPWSPPS